jgi:hypothetical protein
LQKKKIFIYTRIFQTFSNIEGRLEGKFAFTNLSWVRKTGADILSNISTGSFSGV